MNDFNQKFDSIILCISVVIAIVISIIVFYSLRSIVISIITFFVVVWLMTNKKISFLP